jgi:hypothetical protein
MKNDYSFKLVTVIVFAGVIVAFFSPSHASPSAVGATTEVTHAASVPVNHTE